MEARKTTRRKGRIEGRARGEGPSGKVSKTLKQEIGQTGWGEWGIRPCLIFICSLSISYSLPPVPLRLPECLTRVQGTKTNTLPFSFISNFFFLFFFILNSLYL